MERDRRKIDIAVISDTHLGTYGCHARELLCYLQSIRPKYLVLNGDIIDIWQFKKSYWPADHMAVISEVMQLMSLGTEIIFIPGNHDEILRKFAGFSMGNFHIRNKAILTIGEDQAWIFHGDVFDVTMKGSKWLAKLGSTGYDMLILINRFVNNWLKRFGKERISLSKKIKNSVKTAVSFISNFEETAADIGISKGYKYVICGHIHQPVIKEIQNDKGSIMYLNSGDWIENLTSLEFNQGKWTLFHYEADMIGTETPSEEVKEKFKPKLTSQELFKELLKEFDIKKTHVQ